MPANIHLIIHDAIGILSAVVMTAVTVFVLANNHRKPLNIVLALATASAAVFLVSHVIGVSISDPALSYKVLMWNVSVIFICMFNFHCAMIALHREKETQWLIWLIYIIGSVFVAVFLIWPETFLLAPEAKMYLPNYYMPGTYHWLMRLVFQIILPIYIVYEFLHGYSRTVDPIERNRFLYFGVAFGSAWVLGFLPIPLIFGYRIDPMWGLLFPIAFAIPFTYAILQYQLLDIRVIAKKAFLYAIAVVGIGFLIALFEFSNQWILLAYPSFPIWIAPLVIAGLIVLIGVSIWRQLRESEVLKYEFITTVTHKFRTPLTHIKWAAENLKEPGKTDADRAEQIGYIEGANAKLVELTDTLSTASEADENLYTYKLQRNDLSTLTDESIQAAVDHLNARKIPIAKQISPGIYATFDIERVRFVLQTIIENAINYTPQGSPVTISLTLRGKDAVVSVKDSGIGIPKSELPHIFTKLYRGQRARSVDTEGMGIGLYISREIMTRNHGKIWVDSEGEERGSTFSLSLPAAK